MWLIGHERVRVIGDELAIDRECLPIVRAQGHQDGAGWKREADARHVAQLECDGRDLVAATSRKRLEMLKQVVDVALHSVPRSRDALQLVHQRVWRRVICVGFDLFVQVRALLLEVGVFGAAVCQSAA